MQEMIEKLTLRGHSKAEAEKIISQFTNTLHFSAYNTVGQAIDDLCLILDRYKELHGEYVKLVM